MVSQDNLKEYIDSVVKELNFPLFRENKEGELEFVKTGKKKDKIVFADSLDKLTYKQRNVLRLNIKARQESEQLDDDTLSQILELIPRGI